MHHCPLLTLNMWSSVNVPALNLQHSEFSLHVPPSRSLVLQAQHPEEGPPEQRVPQPGVRGEPVHFTGRLLPASTSQLTSNVPLASRHSPKAAPFANRLITPARNRDKSQFFFLFEKKRHLHHLPVCRLGHFWLTGRGTILLTSLLCLSARSPFALTDSLCAVLCCAALLVLSDVCDKKRHEVSPGQAPHSDGEWSRHIWLLSTDHASTLELFFPSLFLVHRAIILQRVCIYVFVCVFFS